MIVYVVRSEDSGPLRRVESDVEGRGGEPLGAGNVDPAGSYNRVTIYLVVYFLYILIYDTSINCKRLPVPVKIQ